MLNFNCAIILVTVCRNLITLVRNTFISRIVPLDKNITFHKTIAWTILLFTFLHVGCHYYNFLHVEQAPQNLLQSYGLTPLTIDQVSFTTIAGATGHMIIICMLIMYTSAVERMRVCLDLSPQHPPPYL